MKAESTKRKREKQNDKSRCTGDILKNRFWYRWLFGVSSFLHVLNVCVSFTLSLYNYSNGLWIYLIAAATTFICISTRQCLFVERKSTNFIVDLKFVFVVFAFLFCSSFIGPSKQDFALSLCLSIFFFVLKWKDSHFYPDISPLVRTIIILYFICRYVYNSLSFYFD